MDCVCIYKSPFHTAMKTRTIHRQSRGFALVATLSLMILLTMLAIGLLSLSTGSLRASNQTKAQAEARANARMAIMLAIGELQKHAGQDTRVTASSGLLSESNVRATGVWRSWEGTDRDNEGRPLIPNYALKSSPGNPKSLLATPSEGRFLGWLASPMANATPDVSSLPGLSALPTPGSVPLVASGSVLEPSEQVHALPTMAGNGQASGAYAWWVSGENSKSMLNVDRTQAPASTVAWHTRTKSDGRADGHSFGLARLDSLAPEKSLASTASLQLLDPTEDIRRLHDISSYNRGLLTNTATGGWRRDLSLLSENYANLPGLELPSLTRKPGVIQTFSKAKEDNNAPHVHPPNALLYPWATYNAASNAVGNRQVPPITSWTALSDFMLQYKYLTTSSAARTNMPFRAEGFDSSPDSFAYLDQVRRSPTIARIQWIFSLCSRQNTDPSDPAKTYQAALLVTPVVTLWNPYNVEVNMPNGYRFSYDHIAPLSFRFRVGSTTYPETTLMQIFKTSVNAAGYLQAVVVSIDTPINLPPGATRIFGVNNPVPVQNASVAGGPQRIVLTPGYRPNGGFMFYGLNEGADVYGRSRDAFAVEEFGFSGKTTQHGGGTGLGMYMEFWANNSVGGKANYHGHRMIYDEAVLGGPPVVNVLYPPVTNAISSNLLNVEGVKNQPFAGAIFGFKVATPRPKESKFDILATKGMLNNNPFVFYSELGGKSAGQTGTGVYHPANSPYDFTYQDVNGWNDTQAIPQFDLASNSGYIVSGLTPSDGLTRCVVAELPTRPLQSLAELQHFDARKNNPIPPFQFNLIGNGSANPIFAPNQAGVPSRPRCNDDTYILNHLLFDDWFISSIAPDLNDFSRTERRSMTRVYQDHLEMTTPLPNRFYLPAPGADLNFDVQSVAKNRVTQMYPYETIASQLEVMGMINVNSVSVDAWRAWLRRGRDARVPFLEANGATQLDDKRSFAFPRTTIAGDKAAGSGSGASNPLFPDADEYAGYRTLTDSQIDALAGEIVEQIRSRGPFLSLSEFVNRRLTNDKSLAAAGAIQQALDNLAKTSSPDTNPYTRLQANAREITSPQPGNTDHKFPEAALGSSAFGVPGWIRQADILTPIAPMISVRDDTFTIRVYGDVRDRNDNSKILARAWCEAVVIRRANYIAPADRAQILPHSSLMKSELNKIYGRRFEIASFRWLHPDEI